MKVITTLIISIFIVSLIPSAQTAECRGSPGQKQINLQPIWKGTPKLVKTHRFGKLFEVGTGSTTMNLLHVYGNMYQMGLAHGTLLRNDIKKMSSEIWSHLVSQFIDVIPKKIPKFLQNKTSAVTLGIALDLTYKITKPFTNSHYYTEMRGIADGSGVSLTFLHRFHMIGQLTKGTCSMFGAWGKATLSNKLIQLRSLDWDMDGPFINYPLAVVYHPSSKQFGQPWLNLGFYGWIGVISGANSNKLGVSQIGVYFNDETFGKQSRFGNPFTFVLRDILQWDKTLNESISRLKKAKRTCNLILGVGDGKDSTFRGFQYSHSILNVVNDTVLLPKNQTWHPPIENIVYYGMDWLCPPFHKRLNQMLTEYYSNITVQNTISHILPGLRSGNVQAVVYDLPNQWVYFSYGTKIGNKKVNAFERPYIGLNLKNIFSEPAPN